MRPRTQRRLRKLAALALGAVFTLVLVEGTISLLYAGFVRYQDAENSGRVSSAEELRILAIGESTTAVAGDASGRILVPQTSYPAQLERILNERAGEQRFRVINNGMMGGTTEQVMALLDPAIERWQPHVIIAMMGIKDTAELTRPGLAWLPRPLRRLRSVQLLSWAAESVRLRSQAVVLDEDGKLPEGLDESDVPEAVLPKHNQLCKFVRETRMVGPEADTRADPKLRLATHLWFMDRHKAAAELLEQVIADHGVGANLLARVLVSDLQPERAAVVLRQAIAQWPQEGMYRLELATVLMHMGELDAAEAELVSTQAALDQLWSPTLVEGYLQLAWGELAREHGDWQRVIDLLEPFEASLAADRLSADYFPRVRYLRALALGEAYAELGRNPEAEEWLKESLRLRSGGHAAMWMLSRVYRAQGRLEEEHQLRQELIEKRPRMAEYYELARMFRLYGQEDQIPALFDAGLASIPTIAANHARLMDTAERHGITLVIMQYPSFSLELLHKYAPPRDGVYFIDNETVFDEDPDRYFFEPRFPNSFSHYTEAGAALLAEHIADELAEILEQERAPDE